MHKLAISTVLLLAVAGSAQAQFTSFRPVVSRQDGNGAALSNLGSNVFLDEYLPNVPAQGAPTFTVAIPTATTTVAGFTQSGTATSEGQLSLSPNSSGGYSIVVAGYSFKGGTNIVASTAAANPRRIALIDQSGAVTLDAGLTDAHSTGNPRSAASSDGTQYWTAGSNEGIRWAATGAATTSTLVSSTVANNRVVNIFAGQLYFSTGSGTTRGIYAVGSGLPTAGATVSTSFINMGGTASPYDFLLFDTNPGIAGLDTAYIAEDSSTGGVQRWNFNGSVWSFAYTIPMTAGAGTTAGARGLAGSFDANGVVTMFATTTEAANRLVRIDDLLTNNTNLATVTTLATAGTNQAFRGVEMYIPTPGAAALLGLGTLAAARRRRA